MVRLGKCGLLAMTGLLTAIPAGVDAQQSPKWTQALSLYVECLQDIAMRGNYTWTDGGASAMRLVKACDLYGRPVLEECMAMYFHPDEKTCQATNALYAQTVLRALHK